MRRAILLLFAALAAAQTSPAGQSRPPQPSFAGAVDLWDRGAYVEALQELRRLLPGADEATFEQVALLTGELYATTEITADGQEPALLGERGLVMYETSRNGAPIVRVVDPEGLRLVAEVEGAASAAASGRHLAYARTGAPQIVIRDLDTGQETTVDTGEQRIEWLSWLPDGSRLLYAGIASDSPSVTSVRALSPSGDTADLATGDGIKMRPQISTDGRIVLFPLAETSSPGGRPRPTGAVTIADIAAGTWETVAAGSDPVLAPDGSLMAFVSHNGHGDNIVVRGTAPKSEWKDLPLEAARIAAPAFSPDGTKIAYQAMDREDWEIHVANVDGTGAVRLTREIQHDVLPRFLTNDRLLGLVGEPRHRRSYVYDVKTGARQRLFHNNTVRTIAPEYDWRTDAAGTRVLIRADRDGDTVSPERGVYLVDLTRRVTRDALAARLDAMLDSERSLRTFAARVTRPLAQAIRAIVDRASVSRVYGYEKALFAFDSKHISQPGNREAADYLHATYATFGYTPEYQWFEPRDAQGDPRAHGGTTANVIATLRGTVHPEVIYVVSSHYDSVARGPGADDDSSGTAALLETARLLSGHPQPATIVFASFTGEEAGLLGSREFVRRTGEAGWMVAGALNNDMIGWANDHRLDNTIRYSNPGIRDIQHAVAMTFTDLVTYDARYYRGTDAHAFYEAWGDIVGGIGSYPVLGNPHYHQPHDVLETINHQLVTEVAKTTAATLVMLTNAPARVRGVKAVASSEGVTVTWEPSPERDVRRYIVEWTGADGRARRVAAASASATIGNPAPGTAITVRAVNTRGLESWDRARVQVN